MISPKGSEEVEAGHAMSFTPDDLAHHLSPEGTRGTGSGPAQDLPGTAAGGGGSAYFAMPRLMGAPAYARPPRAAVFVERPLDPDDLPLAAFRTDEDERLLAEASRARAASAAASAAAPSDLVLRPSSQGGLRSIAARLLRSGG